MIQTLRAVCLLGAAALLAVAQTDAPSLNIVKVSGRSLTLHNGGNSALVGVRFNNKNFGLIYAEPIPAGQTVTLTFPGRGELGQTSIDGAIFHDGHVEGMNRWGIDRHLKMHDASGRGGPVYPDSKSPDESGTSYVFAGFWAQEYKAIHGHEPVIVQPKVDNPNISGPPPTIANWATVSFVHGVYSSPGVKCNLTQNYPTDIGCYGAGGCFPQPNTWLPGKASVFVGLEVSGACTSGYAKVDAFLINEPPPDIPGPYYVASSTAGNSFSPPYRMAGTYIDSCIFVPVVYGTTGLAPCPPQGGGGSCSRHSASLAPEDCIPCDPITDVDCPCPREDPDCKESSLTPKRK